MLVNYHVGKRYKKPNTKKIKNKIKKNEPTPPPLPPTDFLGKVDNLTKKNLTGPSKIKNEVNCGMKSTKVQEFENIGERMKVALESMMGMEYLSWIQTNSIPQIKESKNTLIKSPSGTGKTLSYAVPLVDKLASYETQIKRSDGVYILVIVPTKELAKQTFCVFEKILKNFIWIQVCAVFGEDKRKSEKSRIRKGTNILISTPGRLLDHLQNTQCLDLSKMKALVIDEADMLLDLGYENKMNQILTEIESRFKINIQEIQLILLSATLTEQVKKLCNFILHNYVFIDASPSNKVAIAQELLSCNSKLCQALVIIPVKWRLVSLIWFLYYALANSTFHKIVIFVCSIYSVKFHLEILKLCFEFFECFKPFKCSFYSLHGDMEIKQRMSTFNQFDSSDNGILIATDVAARGLDFKNISWVIQYNPARNPVDYVHRIGRTARAGTDGDAVVFLAPHEVEYANVLKEAGMTISGQFYLNNLCESWIQDKISKKKHLSDFDVENEGSKLHSWLKSSLRDKKSLHLLGAKCFVSVVKSYSSYPRNLRQYFNPKCLHLGHLADSVALDDTPKNINQIARSGIVTKSTKKKGFTERLKKTSTFHQEKPKLTSTISEYSSEIFNGPLTRKINKL